MTTTAATTRTTSWQTLPLLTADEERDLGLRIRDGDRDAFERLVLSNIRLVTRYVNRLEWPSGMQGSDVEQHGMLGLMTAARRYDPVTHPGIRFSTYAMWWIRNYVLRAMKKEGAPIRVPDYLFDAAKGMRLGREVPASIKKLVEKYQAIVVLGTAEGGASIADIAAPPEAATDAEESEALAVAMAGIPDRERAVIEARFYRSESLEVVGRAMGISKQRVQQIECNALKRLRGLMGARGVAV